MPTKKDTTIKSKPKTKAKPKAKPKSTKPTQSQSQHVVVNINKPSRKTTTSKSKASSYGFSGYNVPPISYSYPLYNRSIYATPQETVKAITPVLETKVESVVEPVKANIKVPEEIKKPTSKTSKKAISRISIEPQKSESEMSFRAPSVSSVSNVSSDKSIRFPQPITFKYSDIEKINPSPYPSEMSVGSAGFSGSESDVPTRFSGNVFMEQQANFMKKAQKQYSEKQEKPKPKMRIQFPEEEGGYQTGVSVNTKPIIEDESRFMSLIKMPNPKRKYVRSGKYTKENIGMGKEDILARKVESLGFETNIEE